LVQGNPELAHAQHQKQKERYDERELDRRGAAAPPPGVVPASD
jgi:hypothetical protein